MVLLTPTAVVPSNFKLKPLTASVTVLVARSNAMPFKVNWAFLATTVASAFTVPVLSPAYVTALAVPVSEPSMVNAH